MSPEEALAQLQGRSSGEVRAVIAPRTGGMTQEEAFAELTGGAPPPRGTRAESQPVVEVEAPSKGGKIGRAIVGGVADVVDLLVAGTPALVGGAFAESINRLQGVFDGRSREQIAEEGAAQSQAIGERFGTPIRSALTNAGYLRKDEPGAIEQGMGKVMGLLERDAAAVEERTGGKVLKEDYMMFVNGLFATLGVKGTGMATGAVLSNQKARLAAREMDRMIADKQVTNAIETELEVKGDAGKARTPVADAAKTRLAGIIEQSQRDLTTPAKQRKAERERRREEVRAAFADDPVTARLQEGTAERTEAMRAEQARLSNQGVMPERTRPPQATLADDAARELTLTQAQRGVDVPPYIQRPSGVYVPSETTPQLGVAAPSSLDSGLAKVKRGRLFDLTAEERIAIRGSTQITDPKIVTAAVVGATGLGLALAMEPDVEEAALAIGAGALVAGRGRGLTLETLKTMPDAAPLGSILEQSAYTLRTLEQLPKNRFEFTKTSITQLLRQQDVTAAERAVMQEALDAVPGETITAKQLMAGVKQATGDFELTAKATDQWGDYGLEAISRQPVGYFETDVGGAHVRVDPNNPRRLTILGPDGEVLDGLMLREGETSAQALMRWQDAARATAEAAETATTRIWQSPVELGTANHFQDPNYFAHTRSFEEGGVRHVVELQSDYAQKAGRVLSEAQRAELEAQRRQIHEQLAEIERKFLASQKASQEAMRRAREAGQDASGPIWQEALVEKEAINRRLTAENSRLRTLDQEIYSKLQKTVEASTAERIAPMLKNWHKRLVREEIADAAKAHADSQRWFELGDADVWKGVPGARPKPIIRFADADTVAKVEGWPKQNDAIVQDARRSVEAAERNLSEMEARLQTRGGATPAEQAEARELIPVIREDLRRAQENYATARALQTPRFRPEHQGIYDRYASDVTKFLKQLGGKHIVDDHGHGWWEVPLEGSKQMPAGKRVQQFGGVDQKLAVAIAGIGGGAVLASVLADPDNKARAALWGAVVGGLAAAGASGHAGIRSWVKSAGQTAELALGNVSTTVRGMSPAILRRMTAYEFDVLKNTHDRIVAVAPFTEGFRKLADGPAKAALRAAVTTNDPQAVLRTIGAVGKPELVRAWLQARAVLDEVGRGLQEIGRLQALRPDYFPRIVTDHKGLLEKLGVDHKVGLARILDDAERQAKVRTGSGLSPLERSQLINTYLAKNGGVGRGKPGFLKQRVLGTIDEDLATFYAPPDEALLLYLRSATREIEKAKFFGKSSVRDPATRQLVLESSIGNWAETEMRAGHLKEADLDQLKQILRDRHGPGDQAMNAKLANVRDLTNMGLLGNTFSAFVQTGDVAVVMAAHGMLPTMSALLGKLTKRPGMVKVSDLGLINHISEEMATTSRSARWLNGTFKLSGFSLVDQFGKSTAINAAHAKWKRKLGSPQGEAAFRREYGDYFGRDMDQLVADVRSGGRTRLVDELLFRELSDIQPISRIEVPQLYLRHPDARIAYMLKTFMLKQTDIFRRQVVQKALVGRRTEALGNLLRFGMALGIAGAGTQFINGLLLGRDVDLEWGDIPANFFKTFGYSEFAMNKPTVVEKMNASAGQVLPPYSMWTKILAADPTAIQYIPLVGRLLHNRVMGGAEKYNAWQERKRERELTQ